MSDDPGVLHVLTLGQPIEPVGVRVERRCRGERRRSGVPGRSGTSKRYRSTSSGTTPAQFAAAPPRPWTRITGDPLAADVVAHPDVLDLGGALLQDA